jgi:hypothetical protein
MEGGGGREGGNLGKGGTREEEDFNQNKWLYGDDGKKSLKLS